MDKTTFEYKIKQIKRTTALPAILSFLFVVAGAFLITDKSVDKSQVELIYLVMITGLMFSIAVSFLLAHKTFKKFCFSCAQCNYKLSMKQLEQVENDPVCPDCKGKFLDDAI